MRWRRLAALLIGAALAGCTGPSANDVSQPAGTTEPAAASPTDVATSAAATRESLDRPPKVGDRPGSVVVADISPGVNVYHQAFRRPTWTQHPSDLVQGFPVATPALQLTFGDDYEENLAADQAVWDSYQKDTLYWVTGTNLLLWTPNPLQEVPMGHGHSLHGAATAGAVNAACPACYILVVQDAVSFRGGSLQKTADEMPWVDFVVSSNIPGFYAPPFGSSAYAAASEDLHASGRLFFSFSGNSVVTGFINVGNPYYVADANLPPWVVNVGGAHGHCNAAEAYTGRPPEITTFFTLALPKDHSTKGTGLISGTSFSAPLMAGYFGAALREIRLRLGPSQGEGALWAGAPGPGPFLSDGRLTQEELRLAFSRHARLYGTSDFRQACQGANQAVPVGPFAPLDLGWGFADSSHVAKVVDALLNGTPLPTKPNDVDTWMNAYMNVRRTLWSV